MSDAGQRPRLLVPAVRRVQLVEDHPMVREALAGYLNSQTDFEVVEPAGAGREPAADLVVVAVSGSTGAGLDLVEDLLQHEPKPVVVALSDGDSELDDGRVVARVVRQGLAGWVPKSEPVDLLLAVLRKLRPGDCYLPPTLLGRVVRATASERDAGQPGPLLALTSREREVLQLLVDGADRAEIADRLFLSPNTVRTHTQNLLAKLDVHSVLEAVAAGLRHGLRPAAP